MPQPTPAGLAKDLYDITAETGLTEDAVPFDGHVFVARRNSGSLFDHLRFQIFRDNEPTPYGMIEPHWCEYNGDDWRLWVYLPDGRNTVLPTKHAADHPDGGCVSTYHNALNHLRMAALQQEEDDLNQAVVGHLNQHLTDGRWHDDCRFCLARRTSGGTGLPADVVLR